MKLIKPEQYRFLYFISSYDVVFIDTKEVFLQIYDALKHGVIFSAEKFCWPQAYLAVNLILNVLQYFCDFLHYFLLQTKYPTVEEGESRFLNSGSFVGPAADIYKIITHGSIANEDDDQLYYTKIFLDSKLRVSSWLIFIRLFRCNCTIAYSK